MEDQENELARLAAERNALIHERNDLMIQRNALMVARDGLTRERDALIHERDGLAAQLQQAADLAAPAVRAMAGELVAGQRVAGIDLTGTLICAGFQGSGNGITSAILQTLVAALPHPSAHGMDIVRACAARRSTLLAVTAEEIGRSHGFEETGVAAYHRSMATISFKSRRDLPVPQRVIIFGVPLANAFHEELFKTHEACSDFIATLVDQGARIILSTRHPLDILVSVANKASGDGVDLLGDDVLLPTFLSGMVAYYRSFGRIEPERMFHARYEDLFDNFDGAITGIALFSGKARRQNLDPSRVDHSILGVAVAAKGHRWRPGAGKWRQFLHEGHEDAIRSSGIDRLIEDLGYEPFDARLLARRDEAVALPLRTQGQSKNLSFLLSSAVDHDAVRSWIAQHAPGMVAGSLPGSAFWLAPDQDTAERFAAVLGDPRLGDIVSWR
ncbi:hypothetical protein ACJ4V0_15130 [Phreatobacter sp. HK31-P]